MFLNYTKIYCLKDYDRLPGGLEQFPIFQTLRDHKQEMRCNIRLLEAKKTKKG